MSNFSPRRVKDVADVVPFPDIVTERSCCVRMVAPVVIGERRTKEKVHPALLK